MTSRRFVFVLRIWFEDGQSPVDGRQVPVMRGSIEPIHLDRVHYFSSLDEIAGYIEEMVCTTDPGASSPDRPPPDKRR